MPVRKITISIDEALLSEVEAQAGRAQLSRSEWLTQAARRTIEQAVVLSAMDQILADTGGPSSPEEIARARSFLRSRAEPRASTLKLGPATKTRRASR